MHARRHRREMAGLALIEDEEEVEGADPDMPWWKIMVFLVLGLVGLPLGADLLVDGSINIARMFGVSEVVIGLTLVAVGTSLPELATTVMAAVRSQADVALGNVIGSNMFNLLAIIGITTLIGPVPVDAAFLHFDLWVMLGASLLLIPFVFFKQDITRGWGIALSALYAAYILVVLV
jgi:cation:H+ antiporter